MPTFFPHHAIEWQLQELRLLRRRLLSVVEMAVAAAIVIRALRWVVFALGPGRSWWIALGSILLGIIILLGFVSAHLGNYPIRQWLWRAPVFAFIESAAEIALSALLIAAGVARLGTRYERWHDLPAVAARIVIIRLVIVLVFALVLAAVVQIVRVLMLEREHRVSTALAIHDDHVRQTHEHQLDAGRRDDE
ncbi:MAG TPA: hypothetical protein VFW98_12350 [Gemmatimonadaceae bacterium]|nr:hypothetical protein [Gemmatimonadaceae bacterium]